MQGSSGLGPTILLVEDDPATARMLQDALEIGGYRVHCAPTGAEARAAVEQASPDLMLPDTDGLLLTSALKSISDSPIIICSARTEQVDRVLGLKLGADDFVPKPFDLDELQARIEAVLRRSGRRRATAPAGPEEIRIGELLIVQAR